MLFTTWQDRPIDESHSFLIFVQFNAYDLGGSFGNKFFNLFLSLERIKKSIYCIEALHQTCHKIKVMCIYMKQIEFF